MRKIVIDTGALHELDDDRKILDIIKEAGFSCYDATLFLKDGARAKDIHEDEFVKNAIELRKYADSIGLTCEQAHSFFAAGTSDDVFEKRYKVIPIDMHVASILGAKAIVIHAINEWDFDKNIEYLRRFIPYAHKYNIKIAVENTWGVENNKIVPMCTSTPESFVKVLDTLNDEYVVACLDIGHAEMNQMGTSAVEMIKALGKRLYCLHIHDNDKWCDAHQVPYTHKIPFKTILKCLKENDYQGNITFEVETCYSKGECKEAQLPFELYPAFVKLEYEIGKYFLNYLDN